MEELLNSDVSQIAGVGPKRAELLNKLGVYTIGDLLRLYPRDYIDLTAPCSFSQAAYDGEQHAFEVIVLTEPKTSLIRKNLTITKFRVSDGANDAVVTLFNQKYTVKNLQRGMKLTLYGRAEGQTGFVLTSPMIISKIAGSILPIYPQTAGLSSSIIGRLVRQALSLAAIELDEFLPQQLIERYGLCSEGQAIALIHSPNTAEDINTARSRLIFEELFIRQLAMRSIKLRAKTPTDIVCKGDCCEEFFSLLPFEMTSAQQRAVRQICSDMASGSCMNRLLQGDVGSGKTAVAVAAAYNAAKNGYQTALMAPTELLAQQHYETVQGLLEGTGLCAELLTGSTTAASKKRITERLKGGEIDIIIGTHALITKGVEYSRLGLIITDEQHRFGVAQRGELAGRGDRAHLLAMSATPIPRTLALTLFGDLDISVLNEMPPGRQRVDTYKIDSSKRIRAFNFIKKQLDEGRQGYIVCALVEQNESQLLAATDYCERIKNEYFSGYSVGLLHGKMKPSQKEQVMADFAQNKIQLLVSTTVIEVGVDVPNAVIMMIENAERFGLSQLHQLRGRVGRGQHKSSCILVSDLKSQKVQRRLEALRKTNDGFEIAAEDLRLRGPGDFFGKNQHGFMPFSIADPERDVKLVSLANEAVQSLIDKDPQLENAENAGIKRQVELLGARLQLA